LKSYVCSTPYHLLISLIFINNDDEKSVIFLTTHDNNSEKIFKNILPELIKLENVHKVIFRKRNLLKERLRLEEIIDKFKYIKMEKKIKNSHFYIFPWNPYSLFTISNYLYQKASKVTLIEDGASLYIYPKPSRLKIIIKKYFYNVETDFVKDNKLDNIFVSYPEKYPSHLKRKLKKLEILSMFKALKQKDKNSIIELFLSQDKNSSMKINGSEKMILILTQPLSEDGYISEDLKKKLYEDIVKTYSKDYSIILKKHPRESTVYKFKDVIELEGYLPSEIFTLLGIKFKKAVGICTSAINFINAEEKINIDENFLSKNNQKNNK
jgi:hypothetical protein